MPVRVPLTVSHAAGVSVVHIDQHVHGGMWNTIDTFDFGAGVAQLTLSNNGTVGCEYGSGAFGASHQMCYWVADAMRLVRVADACHALGVPPSAAAIDATCTAAAARAGVPLAGVLAENDAMALDHVPEGKVLSMELLSTHHASEGTVTISYMADGFAVGTRLYVQLMKPLPAPHRGSQILYLLGTVPATGGFTAAHVTLHLPNLHQLVEHCPPASCQPHTGDFQVRLASTHDSDAGFVVHSPPLRMTWH